MNHWNQVNTVHRAGRQTQFAADAFILDDGMHLLCAAKDGVHRAGIDAFGTANAVCLPDDSEKFIFHFLKHPPALDPHAEQGV